MSETLTKIRLKSSAEALNLFGTNDINLKVLESQFKSKIVNRGEEIIITGDKDELAKITNLLQVLLTLVRKKVTLSERDILYAKYLLEVNQLDDLLDLYDVNCGVTHEGKPIKVKTLGQRHYMSSIKKKDIVFGIGPAGTGKTFLAVVQAVNALKDNKVKRIILTRPAVEAGENLGFLPGDLQEKVDPYLRPLYDSLNITLGMEQLTRLREKGILEVAPLAYMRGRTLDDAFVILDEAQNTTAEQMKMFLTRLGFGSKMVITGDITQVDLPKGRKSGLDSAEKLLRNIDGISIIKLTQNDVVRHTLVQKIINAYEETE